MGTIKRLSDLMANDRKKFIIIFLLTGVSTALSLAPPLVVRHTIDNLAGIQNLLAPLLIILALGTVRAFVSYNIGKLTAKASENIAKKLRDRLFNHLQRLPFGYHIQANTGDLIQRCTSDLDNIRTFLSRETLQLSSVIFLISISTVVMFSLSPRLTIISFVGTPLIFFSAYIFHKKIKGEFLELDEKEGQLFATLQENLAGVRVVRAFGRSKFENDKFEEKNRQFRDLDVKLNKTVAIFKALSNMVSTAQIFLILIVGVIFVLNGDISLGTLLVFLTYTGMLVFPIRTIAKVLADLGRIDVSLNRLDEIFNTEPEDDEAGIKPESLKGDIVFDTVSFSYEETGKVLDEISFHIKSGETVGFLGGTGSGKSTIMHMLLRLYDYQSGTISIGGTEVKGISKKYLRSKIGMVLQEPFLYSKSINDNLKMAKENVRDEDIVKATKTANVHHVIENFEDKYETVVGEKGVTLSGGQRQRVAIARTIIKNSDILIFDDSLSAVDTKTDAHIREALKERAEGITTIIIAQRLTTLKEADRIFVIENGKISDSGTHEELIAREGFYKRIWEIQILGGVLNE